MTYPLVYIDSVITKGYNIVAIDPNAEIKEIYPQIVVEKLTTADYMLWQIDNINDIDRKTQSCIVASSEKIMEYPLFSSSTGEIKKSLENPFLRGSGSINYSDDDVFNFLNYIREYEDFYDYVDGDPEDLKKLIKNWKRWKEIDIDIADNKIIINDIR